MSNSKIEVVCPTCQSKLVVDSKTGLVLHSSEKKSGYSFEEALQQERLRKSKADDLFQKAVVDEKRRHDALEEKFRRALESKDELDEPIRPLDLD